MGINYYDNRIEVEGIQDFVPKHVFDCGQCFRWIEEEDGSYTGVAYGKVVNVLLSGNKLVISNADKKDFDDLWSGYLDLARDYGKIKEQIDIDGNMHEAINFGRGIRILNQDEWETLVTFIISANNRIPMIRNAVENLSVKYGDKIGEFRGKVHYSFPAPEVLAKARLEDIRSCKVGFRDKYISFDAHHLPIGLLASFFSDKGLCQGEKFLFQFLIGHGISGIPFGYPYGRLCEAAPPGLDLHPGHQLSFDQGIGLVRLFPFHQVDLPGGIQDGFLFEVGFTEPFGTGRNPVHQQGYQERGTVRDIEGDGGQESVIFHDLEKGAHFDVLDILG